MSEFTAEQLLAHADRDARQLLGRTAPADGPTLAAGWVSVYAAAAEVLTATLQPEVDQAGDRLRAAIDHMIIEVAFLGDQLSRMPAHPVTSRIADTWGQTSALLNRSKRLRPGSGSHATDERVGVQLRVARTLATLTHVTGLELRRYTRQVDQPALSAPAAGAWIRLADRHEHRMLDYLNNRLDDPQPPWASDQTALPAALATWSTVALRRVADPTVPARDLQLISRTQTALLHAAGLLTSAALHRNEMAEQSGPHLMRRLGPAAVAWKAVADQWIWVRTPDAPHATPTATDAAAGLSHAIRATTRTAGFWASAADVADRLPGVAIAPLLRGITESSQVLADIYQHLPNELSVASRAGGRLRAPARLLLQISTENYAARQIHPHAQTSMDVLPVGMHAVTNNLLRPLTPAARERLAAPAAELVGAADGVHQAMLAATPPSFRTEQAAVSAVTPPSIPHGHPVRPGPICGPGVPR